MKVHRTNFFWIATGMFVGLAGIRAEPSRTAAAPAPSEVRISVSPLDLPMGRLNVPIHEINVAERSAIRLTSGIPYRVLALAWFPPHVYVSLEISPPGSKQKRGCLLRFDETQQIWEDVGTAFHADPPPLTCLLVRDNRIYAGTEEEGLWVLDLKDGQARLLGAGDRYPTECIRSVNYMDKEVWIAGGKKRAVVAKISAAALSVLSVEAPHLDDMETPVVTGFAWHDCLWFMKRAGSLFLIRQLNPCNLASYGEGAYLGRDDRHVYVSNTEGVFEIDLDQPHRKIGHATGPAHFVVHSATGDSFAEVERDTAAVRNLYRGTGRVPYQNRILPWYRDTLLPRTRMPVMNGIAGDDEWSWILDGKDLLLYRPESRTWHGRIELPQAASQVSCSPGSIWLVTETKLLRIDRQQGLRNALAKGLPNEITTAEIDTAIARLSPGERGKLLFALGKFREAAECLEKVVAIGKPTPDDLMILFMIHSPWGLDRPEKFRQYGDRLVELYPGTTWSRTVEDWRTFVKTNLPRKDLR